MPHHPIDWAAAEQFLSAIGRNGDTLARLFPPKGIDASTRQRLTGSHRSPGRTIPITRRDAIQAAHDDGRGLYVVINPGGNRKNDITHCVAYWAEFDDCPEATQLELVELSAMPPPSLIVRTGGKSLHFYWLLSTPVDDRDEWQADMRRIAAHLASDPAVCDPSRVMRLPGGHYLDSNLRSVGRCELVHHDPAARYSRTQILEALPDPDPVLVEQPAATAADFAPLDDQPADRDDPRTIDDILEALQHVPQRRPGQGDYPEHRNLLWGLGKALEAIGHDPRQAIQLMEDHSPSRTSGWDVRQVFESGGDAATPDWFWGICRNHGANVSAITRNRRRQLGLPSRRQQQAAGDAGAGNSDSDDQPAGAPTAPRSGRPGRRYTLAPDEVLTALPQRVGGTPRFNIRTCSVEAGGTEYSPDDLGRLYLQLSDDSERWTKDLTADAMLHLARERAYDPVQVELEQMATATPLPIEQWQRLDQHLLGIDDPIAAAFLPQYLISAVARVMRPGCGVRRTPVLIGPQWIGKTRLGAILFGDEHWVENISDLGKDDLQRLQSGWGIELSELNGITRRRDQEALKAFLTAREDVFRAPYGRGPARYQRRCVFWATANAPPLRDGTGATRFVCIPVPDRLLPLDWVRANRAAIWSRAMAEFKAIPPGQEPWDHATEEERAAVAERNEAYREMDPWADAIAIYLDGRRRAGELPVQIPEILDKLDIPNSMRNNPMAARVRQLAEACGWERTQRRAGGRATRGLWPVEAPPSCHPRHTPVTPAGVTADPAPPLGSALVSPPSPPKQEHLDKKGIESTAPPAGATSTPKRVQNAPATHLGRDGGDSAEIACAAMDQLSPPGGDSAVTGVTPPDGARPPWFAALVAQLRVTPNAAAATLAIALDPDGTGRPSGRDVKTWLDAARAAAAQPQPDDQNSPS